MAKPQAETAKLWETSNNLPERVSCRFSSGTLRDALLRRGRLVRQQGPRFHAGGQPVEEVRGDPAPARQKPGERDQRVREHADEGAGAGDTEGLRPLRPGRQRHHRGEGARGHHEPDGLEADRRADRRHDPGGRRRRERDDRLRRVPHHDGKAAHRRQRQRGAGDGLQARARPARARRRHTPRGGGPSAPAHPVTRAPSLARAGSSTSTAAATSPLRRSAAS